MKLQKILIQCALVLTTSLVLAGCTLGKKAEPTPTPKPTAKPKLTVPANIIPVSERPYVTLVPTAAREVIMTVGELKKAAKGIDFELEYSTGDKDEAAIGALPYGSGTVSTKRILLGSQSAGGKITYHEGVTGGLLTLSMFGDNGAKDGYKLANDWTYVDNKKPKSVFTMKDGSFTVETGKLLNSSAYVVLYTSPGLPKTVVEGKAIVAGPYALTTVNGVPKGKAVVKITLPEGKVAGDLYAWNGTAWSKVVSKAAGSTLTADTDLADMFVVIEK